MNEEGEGERRALYGIVDVKHDKRCVRPRLSERLNYHCFSGSSMLFGKREAVNVLE